MTAIPLTLTSTIAIEPAPRLDAQQWVPISEAARALGVSEGQLRRRCAEQLGPSGLARQGRRDDGVTCWHLNRRADRRLLPGCIGEQFRTPSLDDFTEQQVRTARQRAACVEALREARASWQGNQATWLPVLVQRLRERFAELKISERSLRRWYGAYQVPVDLPKLIDQRGGNQRGEADPAAWDYFRSIFLDERRPTTRTCWRRTKDYAHAEGLTWCSYSQCRRKLDEKVPVDVQVQFREPKRWRNTLEPYIEQDPERFGAGECFIGDHAQLDFWCRFGAKLIRPWLTAWMDWRTRRIMGWTLSDSPNSSTILAALRVALQDEDNVSGMPDMVWIDNGKDYDAWLFHGQTKSQRMQNINDRVHLDETQAEGIFALLRIEPHFSLPYNPRGKSFIERWFGTVHDRFDRSMPTYSGCSSEKRPEELQSVLAKGRTVPMFEHVRERLADFIAGYNADAEHSKEHMAGLSPDQAMVQWCKRRRRMADPAALDQLLHHWHRPVPVHRNGITIQPRGRAIRYGQFAEELRRFKGTKRLVRVAYDPADLRTVRVYDEQWRFVGVIGMNGQGGRHGEAITADHVSEMVRSQRKYRTSKRDVIKHREYEYLTSEELLAEKAHQAAKPVSNAPLQVVRTPLDDQAEDVQRDQARASGERVSQAEAMPDLLDFFDGPLPKPVQDEPEEDVFDLFGGDLLSFEEIAARARAEDEGHMLDELAQVKGGVA